MPVFVVLLRAVNVGGTGKLPMSDLKRLCEKAGFLNVRTHIASGNVGAKRDSAETEAKAALEAELAAYAGKRVGVIVRTAAEMSEVVASNPLPMVRKPDGRDLPRPRSTSRCIERPQGTRQRGIRLGAREIYVHYPDGIGRSKLRIPAAGEGTARNMNTVTKLAAMAAGSGATLAS